MTIVAGSFGLHDDLTDIAMDMSGPWRGLRYEVRHSLAPEDAVLIQKRLPPIAASNPSGAAAREGAYHTAKKLKELMRDIAGEPPMARELGGALHLTPKDTIVFWGGITQVKNIEGDRILTARVTKIGGEA